MSGDFFCLVSVCLAYWGRGGRGGMGPRIRGRVAANVQSENSGSLQIRKLRNRYWKMKDF